MNHDILELAKSFDFRAALVLPSQVPVDPKFRAFCEENLCGQYNANYSCPPDCGTPEELHQKLLNEESVLIVQTIWNIKGYDDKQTVANARKSHNAAVLQLMRALQNMNYAGFCAGYNGCPLCNPCKRKENTPCSYPDRRISCMSAYCIDVAKLAQLCELEFAWSQEKLYLFGMLAIHEV